MSRHSRSPSPEKLAKFSFEKSQKSLVKQKVKVINRQQSEELGKIEETEDEGHSAAQKSHENHLLPHRTIVHFETFQKNSLMILHNPLEVDFLDELREMAKVKIERNNLGHLNIIGSDQQVALAKFLIQEEIKLMPVQRGRLNSV